MAKLIIEKTTLGVCVTNCYYIHREGSNKAILIDPAENGRYLFQLIKEKNLELSAILLTHGHFDHIMGGDELRKLSGVKIYAPKAEEDLLLDSEANISAIWATPYTLKPDVFYDDGDEIDIEGMQFKVITTPGHTVGSCCLYLEKDAVLFSGDTLFQGSVGRTDFPTGSAGQLARSLREKILTLPENVLVYPGHGPSTDIGYEKIENPYA